MFPLRNIINCFRSRN